MSIIVEKLSDDDIRKRDIYNWPIWEKEVSVFDWIYDDKEQFYLIEGEIKIIADNKEYNISPGDFVTCTKGQSCKWEITKYVKKHYQFFEE
ncbi:MAG: cupin domain-containing protein [Salinivirgaceae bacterium]|nr:cupin domain-containing protein [Salinivirgaceae bacterium]